MKDWKHPDVLPVLVALATFLVTDGQPVLAYLAQVFAGDPRNFELGRFLFGLGGSIVAALLVTGASRGTVTLTRPELSVVRTHQASAGRPDAAVLTTARQIVPNGEQVLVLRDAPPVPETPADVILGTRDEASSP